MLMDINGAEGPGSKSEPNGSNLEVAVGVDASVGVSGTDHEGACCCAGMDARYGLLLLNCMGAGSLKKGLLDPSGLLKSLLTAENSSNDVVKGSSEKVGDMVVADAKIGVGASISLKSSKRVDDFLSTVERVEAGRLKSGCS
jgi:hypothetical protein